MLGSLLPVASKAAEAKHALSPATASCHERQRETETVVPILEELAVQGEASRESA